MFIMLKECYICKKLLPEYSFKTKVYLSCNSCRKVCDVVVLQRQLITNEINENNTMLSKAVKKKMINKLMIPYQAMILALGNNPGTR